ncbi:MAG: putative ArsR family transcriptional regulator [Oceanospirillaceae bacterium]
MSLIVNLKATQITKAHISKIKPKSKLKVQDSAERILYLVKTQGEMSAKALAKELNMTTVGAGQHLNKLLEKGWVKNSLLKQSRGRPITVWGLTANGHAQYTDRHANLTVDLIKLVEISFGQQGLDQIIQARSEQSLAMYLDQLKGLTVADKVARLVQLRTEEGYMAKVIAIDEGYLLIEDHCPICTAAKACQGFCKTELENFQACFAGLATVVRSEHILEGASRCCYEIMPFYTIEMKSSN